jgi:hypothetical protein
MEDMGIDMGEMSTDMIDIEKMKKIILENIMML